MKSRILWPVCVFVALLSANLAPAQSTLPANPQDDRLTFLLFQLASDEQSIRAVNLALRQAGYRVAVEQSKVASAQKGNELMDRNAGGPISYQDFYGKTARAYVMHDPYGSYHQVRRPPQFDYIYRANSEQADKAQREIASLGQRVDALLARRTSLENEQAALWLQIAYTPIDDRQIPYRPLYHFKLETGPAPAAPGRLNILRPAILFLRTADRAMAVAADSAGKDQRGAMASLDERIEKAQALLENEMLQAKAEDTNPQDGAAADPVLQIARRMKGQCRNAVDASRLSQDENAREDDARKPMFRAQLQGACIALSSSIADLDELICKTASDWRLQPQPKVANPDNGRVPDFSGSAPNDAVAKAAPPAVPAPEPKVAAPLNALSVTPDVAVKIASLEVGTPWLYDSKPVRRIEHVSGELNGFQFLSIPQRKQIEYEIRANKPALIYVFGFGKNSHISASDAFGEDAGAWEPADADVKAGSVGRVWRRHVHAGQTITVRGFEISLAAESIGLDSGSSAKPPQAPAASDEKPLEVTNQTDAPEAQAVIDAVAARYPQSLPASGSIDLVKVHDASEFRRNGGAGEHDLDGAYGGQAVGGRAGGRPMLWGVHEEWPAGQYLIVYRLQALSDVTGEQACFLDVCTGGRTLAGQHPDASEFTAGKWSCIPVQLNLKKPQNLEFRLWAQSNGIVMDRVYVFQVQ